MFFITCLGHFLAASGHAWAEVCHHTAAEICHRQPLIYGQLTQALATLAVLAEESGTDPSILSNTESTFLWMDDKTSSPCLKTRGTHKSRHSKAWIIHTSLTHSDIFVTTRLLTVDLFVNRSTGSISQPAQLETGLHVRWMAYSMHHVPRPSRAVNSH